MAYETFDFDAVLDTPEPTEQPVPEQSNPQPATQVAVPDGAQATTDTPEEAVETPEEAERKVSERKLSQVLKQFENDPAKLASALVYLREKVGKVSYERDQYVKQYGRVDQLPSDAPATPPEQVQLSELIDNLESVDVDTPVPLPAPAEVEGFVPNTDGLFDPTTDIVDVDTGLPLDGNNNPFIPKDELGVDYLPETAWVAYSKRLSLEYPENPVYASQLLMQKRQEELEYRHLQIFGDEQPNSANRGLEGKAVQAHAKPAFDERKRIEAHFGFVLAKEDAAKVAQKVEDYCKAELPKMARQGGIPLTDYLAKDALAKAMNRVWTSADPQQLIQLALGQAPPATQVSGRNKPGALPSAPQAPALPTSRVPTPPQLQPAARPEKDINTEGRYEFD